jgi:SAM-dependent methyltransferase
MTDSGAELQQQLRDAVTSETLTHAVFSSPVGQQSDIRRIDVRPVLVRGSRMLQFTSQSETQSFHQNLESAAAAISLIERLEEFRNVRLVTDRFVCEARRTKKGRWLLNRSDSASPSADGTLPETHNRSRNYLIPEGVPCPFLIETGVMTAEGQVRASHFRKFRQINRFLEFIRDVVDELPSDRPIRIVDFGCGKSYLTFATHYFLTHLQGRSVQVTGLDRRPDVITTCRNIAGKLGLSGLEFLTGDIADFSTDESVDLVISLHACDTATDQALLQAIRWNSRVILAVPCCQHELNAILSPDSLEPITTFGLTRERFAALATDSMRAGLMTAVGYPAQVLEFIETEHTPKNVLLRCVRRPDRSGAAAAINSANAVGKMREQLKISPLALECGLVEAGFLMSDRPERVAQGSGSGT